MNSTIQKLKNYKEIPKNGLVIFCGLILKGTNSLNNFQFNQNNNELNSSSNSLNSSKTSFKKVVIDLEPLEKITKHSYYCDKKFHVEFLQNQIISILNGSEKTGYIICDGKSALFGCVTGSNYEVLKKIKGNVPNKHKAGGQSAVRFERLRVESINNFIKTISEIANKLFLIPNNKNNSKNNEENKNENNENHQNNETKIDKLFFGGPGDLKNKVKNSKYLDYRIQKISVQSYETPYTGLTGFKMAINASKSFLKDLKFMKEKELVQKLFFEISNDTQKYSIGILQTLYCIENGLSEIVLIDEHLKAQKLLVQFKDKTKNDLILYFQNEKKANEQMGIYLNQEEVKNVICYPILDYLIENQTVNGTIKMEVIGDNTSEGKQLQSLGGLASILKYPIDLELCDVNEEDEIKDDEEYDLEDFI